MAPLRLELRASRTLAVAILLVHGAGAAGVFMAVPGVPGAVLAGLLILLGAASTRSRALLRGADAVRVLELCSQGGLRATLADGRELSAPPLARCHVSRWWVVVPDPRGRQRLLVVHDMLSADSFRRLRIWALWGRLPVPAQGLQAG